MKTALPPVLHRRGGYEIRGDEGRILFIIRETFGRGIGAAVSGGMALILLINVIMQYFFLDPRLSLILAIPCCIALALFVLFLRSFLRRRNADPQDVPLRYAIDLGSGTFCGAAGNVMARLGDIAFSCKYNLLSRTYGLYAVLPSKEKILVYAVWVAGFTSAHVKEVRDELERAVSGAR